MKKKRRMINLNLKEHLKAQNRGYADMINLISSMMMQNLKIIESIEQQEKLEDQEGTSEE